MLRFAGGPLDGREIAVAPGGFWLGRDPASAQVVVPEARVSKRHAWIGFRDGRLVIVDPGSTNGTTVNGARVRDAALNPGDRVVLAGVSTIEIRSP
jgi:pSer/pThr/pTyr-binding forkhead associated (FHA) protein